MSTAISTRAFLILSGLTFSPSLLVFAQLFVYPPLNICTACTIPFNLDLPECESPYISECFCQNWTPHIHGEPSGTYITPILTCAKNSCTMEEVDELRNYYDRLCERDFVFESKDAVQFSSLLTIEREEEENEEEEEMQYGETVSQQRVLSQSCSTCLTSFLTNTFDQCTTKDLSRCMCSSDLIFGTGNGGQFSLDCPCASEAENKAALLISGEIAANQEMKMVAPPSLHLLACLRGPRCSGRDKALLARWGEEMCPEELFTGEAVYKNEWEEDLKKNGQKSAGMGWWPGLKKQIKRDRVGSISSWGGDAHQQKAVGQRVMRPRLLWAGVGLMILMGLGLGSV